MGTLLRMPGVAAPPRRKRTRLTADLSPLWRFPQFGRLWSGQLVNFAGSQLTVVAVPYQVFRLTHSSLDVGLVSLGQLVPLLVGSILGGAVADAFDRRRLLMLTQISMGALSAGLALNSMRHHPAVWPLFVLTAMSAALSGTDSPTRNAMISTLVGRESYASAFALTQILVQVGQVAGPALAGALLAGFGVATVFWVDVGTFIVSFLVVARLRPPPTPPPAAAGRRLRLASLTEGLGFLRGRRALQANFLIDIDAMVFGMPRALFPALGLVRFHGGPGVVGLLYAAPGLGALVGSLLTGWVPSVRRQGLAVELAVVAWGVSIVAFGLSPWLAPALVFLALAGAADVVSAVFRNTILQLAIPDSLRGRLSAVHIAVVTGGPRLGDVEAGAVAALAGTEASVVSGGLACLVGVAVLARLMPEFTGYRSDGSGPPSGEGAAPGG